MRGSARIVAVADAGRAAGPGTRLAVLRSEPPLLLRRTGPAQVHLVGGAAGPLGGDVLRLDIEVGAGAELCLRTVAASIALPNRGGDPSIMRIHATVAAGGRLTWLPEPVIAASGCRHASLSTVELMSAASLVWRDELVCGRHGEEPGDAQLSTLVRLDGRTLYRHELSVGPSAAGWAGTAVLGGARATGSVLIVDPEWTVTGPPPPAVLGPTAAVMPLSGPGVVAMATGADLREVRGYLAATGAAMNAPGAPASQRSPARTPHSP